MDIQWGIWAHMGNLGTGVTIDLLSRQQYRQHWDG